MSASGERLPSVLLIWPDEFPRHAVRVDLDRHERAFSFICPHDRRSWEKLRGLRRSTVVLDPFSRAYGELGRILATRGVRMVEGLKDCRSHLQAEARRDRIFILDVGDHGGAG